MKVKLNKMSLVANWSWQLGDNDHCTICMNPFECACPQCKFPGDDCPPIEGKCGHIFHLHCIYKWLDSGTDKCPLDREIWKEKTESEVNNIRNGQNDNNNNNNNNNAPANSNNNNLNQILSNSNEYNNININTNNNQVSNFYFQNNMNDNDNSFNNYQDEERRIQIEEALNFSSHSQSPGSSHGRFDS